MRRVSMATRDKLIATLSRRYGEVGRIDRGRILDEFVAVTGYHRKTCDARSAIRACGTQHSLGRRIYDEAVWRVSTPTTTRCSSTRR
jgi:hypothetical protein